MIGIFLISLVLVFFLALNEFYFYVALSHTQELRIIKGKKGKNYSWIAFGSSYCRYGLASGEGFSGYNFGVAAQFLYYTDKMLREFAVPCLKKNGTVFLIIADLVFAEEGRGLYEADRYQLLLSKESLGDEFSTWKYLKWRIPLIFNPKKIKNLLYYLLKGGKDEYSLSTNMLTEEQVLLAARKRCQDWCVQFGLKDTRTNEIPNELEVSFSRTREILTGMIQFCIDNGFNPVLVVTPVSGIMNSQLGDDFINKVLYDNISLANKQQVPFLDYLRDERFKDISLYHNNADFLNAKGRKIFTEVLLNDAKVDMIQNGSSK